MPEPSPIKVLKKIVAREVLRRLPQKERDWVTSPTFLKSDVWTRLAYDARERNLKLYGNLCVACGRKGGIGGKKLNVDHIYPRKLFPQLALTLENLQLLCPDCNKGKGNRYTTDWRDQTKSPEATLAVAYKPTRDILDKVAQIAPSWDSKKLLIKYHEWCKGKPVPDSPHGAFIGWVRSYTRKSGPTGKTE